MNRPSEESHLALADRHIAEGEARIVRQQELIRLLERSGQSARAVEECLDLLRRTLVGWQAHRELILASLAA